MTVDTVAELTRVDWWIAQQLLGDPQIFLGVHASNEFPGVYSDMAPQNAPEPVIVFAFLGGADKRQGSRRLTNALYLIRAITKGSSYAPIETIADRIDQVLVLPDTGTIVRDVHLSSCLREQPFKRRDQADGVPRVYLGGFYRIRFESVFQ